MELLNFTIVLGKLLIGMYNSRSRNALVSHVSHREVVPISVPLHLPVLQTTRENCRCSYIGGVENKKYNQCNIHVEFFVLDLQQQISKLFCKFLYRSLKTINISFVLLLYIKFIFYIRLFSQHFVYLSSQCINENIKF